MVSAETATIELPVAPVPYGNYFVKVTLNTLYKYV